MLLPSKKTKNKRRGSEMQSQKGRKGFFLGSGLFGFISFSRGRGDKSQVSIANETRADCLVVAILFYMGWWFLFHVRR